MRFTQAFVVAPALLAAAQQTTTNDGVGQSTTVLNNILPGSTQSTSTLDDILTGAGSTASSSSGVAQTTSSASLSSSAAASSSSNDDNTPDNIVTKTFNGGPATLFLNNGQIVGTGFGAAEVISTLRDHRDWNTLVSSVPATTYTTTGNPKTTDIAALLSSGDPALKTITFDGGPATLFVDNGNIVGTGFGAAEVISTLRDHRDWNTLVSSVPATTFTTSRGAQATGDSDSDSDNAAPAVTAAPMLAGGIIGAGMMVVGLL